MERDDARCAVLSIASPHPPLVLRNNNQLMMATEEDKTGDGEVSKNKDPRCGVMRKMPGEGGATMHHRHIHNKRRTMTTTRTITIKTTVTTMAWP